MKIKSSLRWMLLGGEDECSTRRLMTSKNIELIELSMSQEWKRSSTSSFKVSVSFCKHFLSSSRSIDPFTSSSMRRI